jgi:hypothetical protein
MSFRRSGDLDYACARVAARYGARPDEGAWRRVETVRDLAAMLDAARATALRPWTAGLSADTEPHASERVLRAHWRSLAREVATWMPERWQSAVAWSALAPDLATLDFLRRGESPPSWLFEDPLYADWSGRSGEAERAAAPPFTPLASIRDSAALLRAWYDEWRRRLPRSQEREAPQLARLARLIVRFGAEMRAAPPGDASPIVRSLRERLEALYRRAMLEPTAAFAYLALAALDLARLRGEVVRRELFPRLAPAP